MAGEKIEGRLVYLYCLKYHSAFCYLSISLSIRHYLVNKTAFLAVVFSPREIVFCRQVLVS